MLNRLPQAWGWDACEGQGTHKDKEVPMGLACRSRPGWGAELCSRTVRGPWQMRLF